LIRAAVGGPTERLSSGTIASGGYIQASAARIQINGRSVIRILAASVLGVALLSIPFRVASLTYPANPILQDLERFFDLNSEANLPTWLSVVLFLICALLLAAIALHKQARREPHRYWSVLAAIFVLMSLDEGAQLHEMLGAPSGIGDGGGLFYHSWVVVGLLVVAIVGWVFLRFLRSLPPKTMWWFVAAGSVFVFGALVLEMVEGYVVTQYSARVSELQMRGIMVATTHTQEVLEMAGLVMFIYALLDYARTHVGALELSLSA
jgi:hypothetical protein